MEGAKLLYLPFLPEGLDYTLPACLRIGNGEMRGASTIAQERVPHVEFCECGKEEV